MKLGYRLVLGLAVTCLATACQEPTSQNKLLDPANMDQSVHPGDDFFQYVNGNWLKNNPIPSTETSWGSFNELIEKNNHLLRALLEDALKDTSSNNLISRKIGMFYKSGIDSAAIDAKGIQPVQFIFDRIDAIKNPEELQLEIARLHTQGNSVGYSFYVFPDDKNVTRQIAQFYQGGLGLPDRDYYFNQDSRSVKLRNDYQAYQEKMFTLMGNTPSEAKSNAHAVYQLEKTLAQASLTRVETRDPYRIYNKFSLDTLMESGGGFDWRKSFEVLGVREDSCIIGMPEFFKVLGKQFQAQPLSTWKAYLKFHVMNDMAPYLSSDVNDARFAFYGKSLRGQEEQKPRWYRVLQVVDGSVGELLGQVYVHKHFTPEAKQRMLVLVDNLQQTYAERIKRLDWMSDITKQKALAKLNTFLKKIGYPDKWKNYDSLKIGSDDYVENVLNAASFEYQYMISKLGKPVDKSEWQMSAPTVNAYYNPAFNEIVFPAGILQFPFFDFDADDAVNYGGIGSVIGHEMTHGFDDQGRQYDANGNLNDWWTADDAAKFQLRANKVVALYNGYTVLDTVHINGELTLGENLADFGGLAIAYEAFMKTSQAKAGDKIDGFTPEQRFFMSWAQIWRNHQRPEEALSRIITDPHSPGLWRCNAPLSHMDAFYKAFDIKPGHKMYVPQEERISVW